MLYQYYDWFSIIFFPFRVLLWYLNMPETKRLSIFFKAPGCYCQIFVIHKEIKYVFPYFAELPTCKNYILVYFRYWLWIAYWRKLHFCYNCFLMRGYSCLVTFLIFFFFSFFNMCILYVLKFAFCRALCTVWNILSKNIRLIFWPKFLFFDVKQKWTFPT